jgi:uncharacterized membrane protein YbhN (UPF0104 family)
VRKPLATLLKVVTSAALLVWLVSRAGPQDIGNHLAGADLALVALAFGGFLLGVAIRSYRWRALLDALHQPVPMLRLVYLYLVGLFFSNFLPTGMGGDVVKAAELRRDTRTATAVSTVVSERLMGLLGAALLALIALPFSPAAITSALGGVALLTALGIAIATWLLLQPAWLARLGDTLPFLRRLTESRRVRALHAEFAGQGRRGFALALAISLPFALSNVVVYWLVAQALGVSLPLGAFLLASPFISLATLLPSINSFGVREGAYQLVFVPLGVSASQAIAMSLVYQALRLAAGLLGGALYVTNSSRQWVEVAPQRSSPSDPRPLTSLADRPGQADPWRKV